MKKAFLVGFVLLFGGAAFAQDAPKMEVTGNYSYMRFNPENNSVVGAFSLNGGGLSGVYFITKAIGIKAEFEGYGSTTKNLNTGEGTVPVTGNLFTYNVGPEVKFRTPHFEPFFDVMFGGAHSNAFVNVCTARGCAGNPSNNAFDFILGGGIDIPVTKSISIRPAEADFVLTRFGNGFTNGNNNQSNFRFQAGVSFRF
jgi:hypothetical protein